MRLLSMELGPVGNALVLMATEQAARWRTVGASIPPSSDMYEGMKDTITSMIDDGIALLVQGA